MADPFLGEIRVAGFGFAPKGWALCNGQVLPINTNQALFAILGTTYGGNGTTTFALPDLRGRVPLSMGTDAGGENFVLGQAGGEAAHALATGEMPSHTHALQATTDVASSASPGNALPAAKGRGGKDIYAAPGAPVTAMGAQAIAASGGGQPHENQQPYTTLNFIIALQGIFPSRN